VQDAFLGIGSEEARVQRAAVDPVLKYRRGMTTVSPAKTEGDRRALRTHGASSWAPIDLGAALEATTPDGRACGSTSDDPSGDDRRARVSKI
jgi:hypothetical protein